MARSDEEERPVEKPSTPPAPVPLKQQLTERAAERASQLNQKLFVPIVDGDTGFDESQPFGPQLERKMDLQRAAHRKPEGNFDPEAESEASRLSRKATDDISSSGGAEEARRGFLEPRVINSKGFMSPSAESSGFARESAPADAQKEFRELGAGVNRARFGAEAEVAEAGAQHQDQVATIMNQVSEYQEAQHARQLEVQSRQEALTARHEELMQGLEKEIAEIPNAPRTIREKLEASGIGDKIQFGFAAALSVLGSARNGGDSARQFLSVVNGNINALVQKEKDEYEKVGEKAKRAGNVYAASYKAMGDSSAAFELTRKLYMEAADASLKEQAARYAGALTGPNAQKAIAEWEQMRLDNNLKAAGTVKQLAEKTMKWVPPSQRIVYAPGDPRGLTQGLSSKDMEKLPAYQKYLDDRGFEQLRQASNAIKKAVAIMPEGFDLSTYIAQQDPGGMLNKFFAATDDPKTREIKQHLQTALNEVSRAQNGQSKTANEIIATAIQTQLHNKGGAARMADILDGQAQTARRDADASHRLSNGAPVGVLYDALREGGRL